MYENIDMVKTGILLKIRKCNENEKASRITGWLKRALDFSNALVSNLLRKWIGRGADLPSVKWNYKE